MLEWVDKVDGIDDVLAKDINDIAHAVIELEEDIKNSGNTDIDLSNYYNKSEIDDKYDFLNNRIDNTEFQIVVFESEFNEKIGDIETAIDTIIAIQNELLGGGS